MPTTFSGTPDERRERLERNGRRCDGQNRFCVSTASTWFKVVRADGKFNPLPGAEPEIKKACGKHYQLFGDSGVWKVLEDGDIAARHIKPGKK